MTPDWRTHADTRVYVIPKHEGEVLVNNGLAARLDKYAVFQTTKYCWSEITPDDGELWRAWERQPLIDETGRRTPSDCWPDGQYFAVRVECEYRALDGSERCVGGRVRHVMGETDCQWCHGQGSRLELVSERAEEVDEHGEAVYCAECHLRKQPRGRSAPLETAKSLCDPDCPGYDKEPRVGELWPRESRREFGYPLGWQMKLLDRDHPNAIGMRFINDTLQKREDVMRDV